MNPPAAIRCMVSAGEVSGDHHAAACMRAMRAIAPLPVSFFGIGGDAMRAAGCELLHHTDDMGVMGAWEVLARLPSLQRALRDMTRQLDSRRPDVLLTVDYPGFNLRLAARAHARGIPTVQYICPKVWAWNRRRIPRIASVLDRLLTVFPFEATCFRDTPLAVTFVGHPLAARARETLNEPPPPLPWEGEPRIALLPGSRESEIRRIFPVMLSAAQRIVQRHPQAAFIVPAATPDALGHIRRIAQQYRSGVPQHLRWVDGQARHVLRQARGALVASGTASLEASLMECPTVIVYRVAWPTYLLGRWLIRGVRHIGLANIMSQREVCPELIQGRFTPDAACQALLPLLEPGEPRAAMITNMQSVNRSLGDGHADRRAAQAVLDVWAERRSGTSLLSQV